MVLKALPNYSDVYIVTLSTQRGAYISMSLCKNFSDSPPKRFSDCIRLGPYHLVGSVKSNYTQQLPRLYLKLYYPLTVESCQSQSYHTMLNCSLFIHALAKWLDITSFDAEMMALCLDGKATLMSLTIILINTLEAGSHRPALARFYSIFEGMEMFCECWSKMSMKYFV